MNEIISELLARLDVHTRLDHTERAGIIEESGIERMVSDAYGLLCLVHRCPMALSGVTLLRAERESQIQFLLTTDPEGLYRHLSSDGWIASEVDDLASVMDELFGGMATLAPLQSSYMNTLINEQ